MQCLVAQRITLGHISNPVLIIHTLLVGEIANFVGTSLSTPVWGAIITLINQARSAKNQPPVGFVQPVLYKNPQAFHDITTGINPGCGKKGFPASKGASPEFPLQDLTSLR